MVDKEVIVQQENTDIMSLIWKYAKTTTLGNVIAGFAIIILVLQLSGLSVGSLVDKWFGLKQTEIEQSYQLQLKTFDLMNMTLLPKIDTLQKDVTNLREEVASIRTDASNIKNDLTQLSTKVNGLEKKVADLETENGVVHALWRRNNAE